MELAFIGLGLVGTVVAAFRFRPSWFVWMAGNWILFTSTSFVLSVPRYSLTLFPLFAWFALMSRRIEVGVALSIVSVGPARLLRQPVRAGAVGVLGVASGRRHEVSRRNRGGR